MRQLPSPTGGRTVQPNILLAAKTLKGEPCAKVLEINVNAALRQHYTLFEMASLATAFCKLGATADYPPGQNQPIFAEKQPSLAI